MSAKSFSSSPSTSLAPSSSPSWQLMSISSKAFSTRRAGSTTPRASFFSPIRRWLFSALSQKPAWSSSSSISPSRFRWLA